MLWPGLSLASICEDRVRADLGRPFDSPKCRVQETGKVILCGEVELEVDQVFVFSFCMGACWLLSVCSNFQISSDICSLDFVTVAFLT